MNILIAGILYGAVSMSMHELMQRLTDQVAGIHPSGWLARELIDTIRLVYYRGLFDGFVAGAILVFMSARRK